MEFEDRLTDYLDGALIASEQRACAEHVLRCPVCHDLLNELKNTLLACSVMEAPAPSPALEARILMQTAPECAMTCADFEEHLTDYLDGFLPANLYHRWERHAALCANCTELPGQVVRSIGACYSYISEERAVPAGLHARILQTTLGTTEVESLRAPFGSRAAAWVRDWLDVVVSPQLATVATMVLVAVLVGTSTLSDDGTIGGMYRGMYRTSLRFATQAYVRGATSAARSNAISDELNRVADGVSTFVGEEPARNSANEQAGSAPQSAPAAVSIEQPNR